MEGRRKEGGKGGREDGGKEGRREVGRREGNEGKEKGERDQEYSIIF